ncbi:MAG: hypothetical protein VX205_10295 [Pseudomonadota bacterium]|nr:hypothetical protein [Sphingobium sp.]MCC4252447.1 hypothetical protein [Sphingobium naphthae]MEC8035369.1 hypothetical protein [Pseudomonadota bacterium]|tara:strand:- start:2123 stop:2395 length:273 start_codon:yes stop_codon:yes gene_type:complete
MTDTEAKSKIAQFCAQALLLGLGIMLGWSIGGERKEAAALKWAVATAHECETAYDPDEIVSVSSCLQDEIDQIDDDRKEEARTADHDPRR